MVAVSPVIKDNQMGSKNRQKLVHSAAHFLGTLTGTVRPPSIWKLKEFTGKSLSEALIFASTNPQYENRLFIELQVQYMKIPSSKLGRTCCIQKLFLTFRKNNFCTQHVLPMFCKKKSF